MTKSSDVRRRALVHRVWRFSDKHRQHPGGRQPLQADPRSVRPGAGGPVLQAPAG